jgi:hypothetical protein
VSTLAMLHAGDAACCVVHTSSLQLGRVLRRGHNELSNNHAHDCGSAPFALALFEHGRTRAYWLSRCARVTSARRGVHGVMLCLSCSEGGCVELGSVNHSRHLPLRLVGSYWTLVHVAPSYRRWCGTSDTASHNQCQCAHERAARRHLPLFFRKSDGLF